MNRQLSSWIRAIALTLPLAISGFAAAQESSPTGYGETARGHSMPRNLNPEPINGGAYGSFGSVREQGAPSDSRRPPANADSQRNSDAARNAQPQANNPPPPQP
jgi:hypothetical protein